MPLTEEEIAALQAENATLTTSVADLTTSQTAMQGKMDTLLGETKKAKADKAASEEAAREATEAAARKGGDFEQLHKSSETARQGLQTELDGLRSTVANEKRNTAALKIATGLADGHNVELLANIISGRLKPTDEGVKVLDSAGNLTISTLDDFSAEVKNDVRLASLLKGNQSGGGGANGGGKESSGGDKTMPRAEFEQLNAAGRMKFIKDGGTTYD
jgi:hypothetical protein